MSLGEDVILEFAQPYTLSRSSAPALVNGRAQAVVTVASTIRASIQPTSGRDLLLLDETMRTREGISIYTPDFIRTADEATGAPPDVVEYSGERWQVMSVKDWSGAAGFYKAVALKIPR